MKLVTLKSLLTGVLALAICFTSYAQELPRKSPKASIGYTVGLTDISINYSSPAVAERDIFGGLLEYDKIWRTGANEATTIEFSTDVKIMGKSLAAGKYSFFLIPKVEGKWTAIFNKNTELWGEYGYQESEDALRVDVENKSSKQSIERLKYDILDKGMDKAYIRLSWSTARVYMVVRVDYMDTAIANVEKALTETEDDKKWQVYASGADFLLGSEAKPELALEWANKSADLFQHSWNLWIKARVQAANGDKKGAIATAQQAKEVFEANEKDNYYNNVKDEVEAKVKEWSSAP